ncbi:MAG: hypothetical protein E5Y65_19845 [Mesorhizobium sp.]|uniref:hypothetical protein n=1 Tax=Mesorhizobium sp. TaxID=1871066 RepID=UPI001203546D|nr:hypothetical protein [Mesorhizobium sp.]TIL75142.1 MAG: hypothetical protein E5Y70_09435 [Mesorhizobium sp.]TIL88499.1 MAG: hypothetical protein E5Y65_19845 [Mesorhizobium sp.]TIL99788.1 MAG: hypothetical protein E5Y64_19880 [Mesorhizobium sp.]TIN21011.1 MAG: hypothetical protein E5Y59_02815 [Mesorhizobium sp.]
MPIHLPKKSAFLTVSKYDPLGLRDMPFPSDGFVDPYSSDPRINGSIYAVLTAESAIKKFENLLIRPDDFPNRVRLAYLWSKGDSQSGRGVGKTALLRYFRQRINSDWGQKEFSGQFSAVVVYVGFRSQVDRRHMEQLALSALVDICQNGVLEASRAALRLSIIPDAKIESILSDETEGTSGPDNLLNDLVLSKHGIDTKIIDERVCSTLISAGVEPRVALALAHGGFEEYLRSMRKDGALEPLYVPRDTKILDYSRTLLFNDIVKYLRAAGYGGGYLFIDDIENLVDQMARRERIEFAKEFGLCMVRPGYANTEYRFFSAVLTTHQQASVSLSQAWGEAGLAAIGRLDPSSPNSVELPFPSKEQAQGIIVAHLDYFRKDEIQMGTIKPFTQDGIDTLLSGTTVHPRATLSNAAKVVQYASDNNKTSIDAACVKAAGELKSETATPDFTEGIEGAL